MCAIIGALLELKTYEQLQEAERILEFIWTKSAERGRDGRGYSVLSNWNEDYYTYKSIRRNELGQPSPMNIGQKLKWGGSTVVRVVGNLRAEPTTEWVERKRQSDQQPYVAGDWTVVHNGTIANDKELRSLVGAYQVDTKIDSAAIPELIDWFPDAPDAFDKAVKALKGSYAIIAAKKSEPNWMFVACNYRPIWYMATEYGVFFASSEEYFPKDMGFRPVMIEPYSSVRFNLDKGVLRTATTPLQEKSPSKALVVCSGGLDSVVAATKMVRDGFPTELIHFHYGSRAEMPELHAVQGVAKALGVPLHIVPMRVYDPSASPLLRADSTIAGGEAGAEFAHEWVPARNLVMLALATAFAESHGFNMIVLGNNLEEAGAYPDNEPEFINRFNAMLPFAVGDGKRVRVVMPVGNLMKHEIVKLGLELNAPIGKSWSCYRAGEHHCGTCGPCFMRRTAFKINNAQDPTRYEK